MRYPRLLIGLLAATACWVAGAGALPAQELAAEQILRRGNGAEPATLDPHKATGVTESNILRDLYEGLVAEAPDGTLVPGAAESWEIGPDGLEYTFRLQPEGRWSNGDPVTAEDFAFSFRRAADPATASDYAFILAPIRNAEDITAGKIDDPGRLGVTDVDARTLKIRLKAPTPYFLGMLTHSMAHPVHRPSLEEYGDRFTRPGNLVSNGPYRLAEWSPQERIVLRKSETYRDRGEIAIEEVHYYPTEDQSAELRRYRADELDMTGTVPLEQLNWVRENLPGDYRVSPYLGTYYYVFNLAKPPFQDNPALRRALALAINRELLTEKITRAGQIPAYGWVPPGVLGYEAQRMTQAALSHGERIALAKELYAQAGYSDADPLEVEILYNTSEGHKKIAIAIAAMWRQALGVRTRMVNREWKVYLNSRQQGQFQIARAGWIGDYNDANTFAELMLSDSGINDAGFANAEYDRLVRRAALTPDPAERAGLLQNAERVLLEVLPVLPIFFYVSQSLVKPYVLGWEPNILDHHPTRHLAVGKH